jgi:neurotransmitter:Na+ symporter, NSS family
MKRERLGSRLGFIMLSAGCAIGCGNVWKFPWMCGQNGGGSFMLVYILCLIVLGIPCLIMEFSVGRASQTSPINMYKKLEKPKQKWGGFGWACLVGNISLTAFYTVVCGWLINYFVKFVSGNNQNMGFDKMTADPSVNVLFLFVTVVVAFFILSFNLQGGLERVTKYMMIALLVLMVVLAVNSLMLGGAGEGMTFYLKPDFSKINGSVVVGAMNQAFFTLSTGMGGMAIFGSYIDKNRSLMGEAVSVISLDTLVAILAGGGMMMLLILTSVLNYELKTAVGTSVFIMTFTALTGAVSHFMIDGTPDLLVWILCIIFTLIWARIASVFANKAEPKTLNRATGIVLVILGVVIMAFNLLTK